MVDFNKLRRDKGMPVAEDHISNEVREAIENAPVTMEEYNALRLNSYERDALIPFIANDVLLERIRHTLQNCSRPRTPSLTYEDSLQRLAEELARRLEAYIERGLIMAQASQQQRERTND